VFFRALAEEMIDTGEAEEVAETCQQLLGEVSDPHAIPELTELSLRAQQHLSSTRHGWGSFLRRMIDR